MYQKEKKSSSPKYISVENLIYRLGLPDEDVWEWINKDKPNMSQDHMGRTTVPFELLEQYSRSSGYIKALNQGLVLENLSMGFDDPKTNLKWKVEKLLILESCRAHIIDLETIHRKYLQPVNISGYGSKIMAAYLLFSRIISTLKMCCLCQEHDYWHWGSQLREIDEGLTLAEYFITAGDSPKGSDYLHKWFRQSYAPKDSVCRDVISESLTSTDPSYTKESNLALMEEIYEKKSKLTHQTFRSIREITKFKILNGMAQIDKIEYGPIGYQRKLLELTIFFRSNFLTCFPYFLKCFQGLPLRKEDTAHLCEISRKLMDEDTKAYRNEGRRY